jgi:hypothetical protein
VNSTIIKPPPLAITELEPDARDVSICKRVNRDGSITQYPNCKWWKQSVAQVPATIYALFEYLVGARERNICLIRGAPANLECERTRRQKAGVFGGRDRGDHGFIDAPTELFFIDVDGFAVRWRDNPQRAMRSIVAELGEPWASASFGWFFSATHGLEMNENKRWTGEISDGLVRARLAFITTRALNEAEAGALTALAKLKIPKIDPSISRLVQPNYIRRLLWPEHPERDVLGDIPTIGWIRQRHEYLAVPEDLTHTARWAKAQGHHSEMASHPDAETAVRGIGIDASVRSHLKSAVWHLLAANPAPEVVSFADHAAAIVAKLQDMVERQRAVIVANLARHDRGWSDVAQYLPDNMTAWAQWLLDHPAAVNRKLIKLVKRKAEDDAAPTREAIYAQVERVIERACGGENTSFEEYGNAVLGTAAVELLVAPTGSRKSTLMRAAAVRFVSEHPEQSVVICMPRHKLGDEQIALLRREHPDANFSAAVWRGRDAWDPDIGDGRKKKMCQRPEAKAVQDALLNVEHSLCRQGRGADTIACPYYDRCGYQRQKQVEANVWFAAHECMAHEMPKVFGDVGLVMIDESPLDAFTFGVDSNDKVSLPLDLLHQAPANGDMLLAQGREAVYRALDKLRVPIDRHLGVPASRQSLHAFLVSQQGEHVIELPEHDAGQLHAREWRNKVVPKIRPSMTAKQIKQELQKAAGNSLVKQRATLFDLINQFGNAGQCGRIQVQRGSDGREVRMVGLHPVAKGWRVRTLISDATGDPELLRAIWPHLDYEENTMGKHGWQQLPRPNNVRLFQLIDRSISKYVVAVEGSNEKELERKQKAAHRMYAALLAKALGYGGAPVAAVVYKSTEDWVRKHCFVPDWLTLTHHGDVTGTDVFKNVRALFVVGRPLPPAETVTRQTEAMFGKYIPKRAYRKAVGRIPIVPNAQGNTHIEVATWKHPYALAEHMRRHACEGALIQAVGRARAGLRTPDEPLDVHLWTDVPLPELGPAEPVLWEEVEAGLDGLMLATGGVWFESAVDAAEAYKGRFTVDALKQAKKRGEGTSLIGTPIRNVPSPHLLTVRYQPPGKGQRPRRAVVLPGVGDPRAWLEQRLGPLVRCEVEGSAVADVA